MADKNKVKELTPSTNSLTPPKESFYVRMLLPEDSISLRLTGLFNMTLLMTQKIIFTEWVEPVEVSTPRVRHSSSYYRKRKHI